MLGRFTPIRSKRLTPRRGRQEDAGYLRWLRTQPCSVPGCKARDIEAAHVGSRGYGRRSHDREAISLCGRKHHREGPEAHHVLGKLFWDHHGIDRWEVIRRLNTEYEAVS